MEMVTMVFSSEDVVATDAAKRRRDTAPPREKYTMETSMALAATVVGYVVESAAFSATVASAISCSIAFPTSKPTIQFTHTESSLAFELFFDIV